MIYHWKNGGFGVPAQLAGERIEAIREQWGRVYARDVVEDARPEQSPLHPCFEWDDAKAAESWRTDQAGQLLRALVMVPEEVPDVEPVRAFIAIGPENAPNDYMPVGLVMGDEELRRRALNDALNELRRARQKYHGLRELGKVWEQIDALPVQVP